ncbi:hypothetical protein [Candidatus Vidania fulgoroideorum]
MKYIKMHSYGNNFLIIVDFNNLFKPNKIKIFNDKFSGISFDQIILIEKYFLKKFYIKIYNNDSSLAYNCINGLRCAFKYLSKKTNKNKIYFKVYRNIFVFTNKNTNKTNKNTFFFLNNISKDILFVSFNYKKIFLRNIKKFTQINFFLKKQYYVFLCIGNYHLISFNFLKKAYIKKEKQNIIKLINFDLNLSVYNNKTNNLITLERGSGFTQSCGSATAAFCYFYSNIKQKNIRLFNTYGSLKYFYKQKCIKAKSFFIYKGNIKI